MTVPAIEDGWRQKQRQRSSRLFREAEFVQFLAALAVLPRFDLEETVELILFFEIDRGKTASAARN